MKILAFDIGGANTKRLVYENGDTKSSLNYFPLWKRKDRLRGFLEELGEDADVVAVTMTAELCDVFSSKEDGARFIVSSCEEVFGDPFFLTLAPTLVKENDIRDYKELAAANWRASLYLMEKRFGEGVLVDVGSTTTDILPFGDGARCFKSDMERMKASQLLYTGYLRTPVNTIVSEVPLGRLMTPVASDYFAITADIHNILEGVDYTCETPDGEGKSRDASIRRMARLLCADKDEVEEYIPDICRYVHEEQVKRIAGAVERVCNKSKLSDVYAAGVGKKLAMEAGELLGRSFINLEKDIKDAWNLPCLGLAEMVIDME
jgi:probable H4MPT-linked C1 transfer pathway protein